ncbi:cryptochrome/photolyase family protein [Microbaculum sp. FT89]|uniref:cryptochrome/photolyase family protein n=1 Tax=Microbaculum sp. FT89 TaxID=3447298 RepID=UPI003F53BE99
MPVPSNTQACSIVWFRDDLRIADNPALDAAVRRGLPVVALYVLDEESAGIRPLGGATRWWLHHSLTRLRESLTAIGIPLVLRRGAAEPVLTDLAASINASLVTWNRRYGGPEVAIDTRVKSALNDNGVTVESFAANLLYEPWTLKPASAPYYRVFTPFWKAARAAGPPRRLVPAPGALPAPVSPPLESPPPGDRLDDWTLLPRSPDWSGGLAAMWVPGEDGARAHLKRFLDGGLADYARLRDRPDKDATTMMSPHLRFGEISPNQIWHAVQSRGDGLGADKLLAEIGWREFSWHLLYHNPDLATRNLDARFDRFPWRDDPQGLRAWQRGQTGYAIVDAGMRQLWATGWMHNRVRMIAASFLIKDLMIDWRAGEAWFWDTLVDADMANNPASWQWVAGCGADAAPFFRVFNPTLQAEKFDPDGAYVRQWLPERAGGDTPARIVDHAAARRRALEAFKALKQ